MFVKRKTVREHNSGVPHPDYENVNTSVVEYFRKYGQGKIDQMPGDSRPEVSDDRSVDEMVNDDSVINHLSADQLDALQEMENNREAFEAAIADIELTQKQKQVFLDATKIIDDPNSTQEQRFEAYEALRELGNKVTRARKN